MYWEDIYEMYEYACNLDTLEQNEKLRFNFMIHAGSKEAMDKWEDQPIPYPSKLWVAQLSNKKQKTKLQNSTVLGQEIKRVKGTAEDTKRFKEVSERLKQHKKKVEQQVSEYYTKKYY